MYIYIHIYTHTHTYIYIHIMNFSSLSPTWFSMYMCVCVCVCVYIYIYIYTKLCLFYMAVKFSLSHLRKYIGSWRSISRYRGNICALGGGVRWGKGEMASRRAAWFVPLTKYYRGSRMKINVLNRTCGTYGREERSIQRCCG
jgi:hypothetical protein